MKRNLLTMALAMVFGVGAYAFETGQYIYTKDAKLKVTDATNKITNDNYAQADGWISEKGGALAANWLVTTATKDDAQVTVLQSENATNDEGSHLTNAWVLPTGIYALSYWVYSPSAVTTSITAGGNNFVSFYVSADGTTVARQINATTSLAEAAWTQVTDTIQVNSESETVWFKASQVAQGIQFTDFQLVTVKSVYDTRIAERELAYAKQILEDANFKTDYAIEEGFYDDLADAIEQIEGYIATGDAKMETETTAATWMNGLAEYLADYMDASTVDLTKNTYFGYIEDLTSFPKQNRGQVASGATIGGFKFYGDNWYHGEGADFLIKQIQGSFVNGPGSVVLTNEYMPAGKYFVIAEMRNADCGNDYTLTYNLESPIKGFVGTDSVQLGTIVGEEFTRLYFVRELKEGETFEAGFYWDNQDPNGSTFHIKNFQVRAFDKDIANTITRIQAFENYIKQWNAATAARTKMDTYMNAEKKVYPWGQNELKTAWDQYNPIYEAHAALGWSQDGKDTRVASVDTLTNWALYQDIVSYDTKDDQTQVRKEYGLVRGFQNANNAIANLNKPFADLRDAITDAKAERVLGKNAQGDRDAFKTAIETAITTLNSTLASTTDATRVADSTTIDNAIKALAAAKKTFLEEVESKGGTTVLADIDFSIPVEVEYLYEDGSQEATDSIFTLRGTVGAMVINKGFDRYTKDGLGYAVGYDNKEAVAGMLRTGNVEAVVDMDGIGESDVVTISFDIHYAQLQDKNYAFAFRNADNQHVAGFSYQVNKNWTLTSNPNELGIDASKINRAGTKGQTDNDAIITAAKAPGATHFEIVFDYGKKIITTTLSNKNSDSPYVSTNTEVLAAEENNTTIAKFVLSSNCNNSARRSWFDNLKISKISAVPEDIEDDITDDYWPVSTAVKSVKKATFTKGAIYDLTGRRVVKAAKGLYIKNGKKYVIK